MITQGTITRLTNLNFVIEECINCGVQFGMTSQMHDHFRQNRKSFHCPNGHSMYYPEDTEKLRMQRKIDKLANCNNHLIEQSEASDREIRTLVKKVSAHKGQVTKIKNRIKAGVCPCCNRTFQNLQKHMETQHKDFVNEK